MERIKGVIAFHGSNSTLRVFCCYASCLIVNQIYNIIALAMIAMTVILCLSALHPHELDLIKSCHQTQEDDFLFYGLCKNLKNIKRLLIVVH